MAGDPFYDDMVLLWRAGNGFIDESSSGLTLIPQKGYNVSTYDASGWNMTVNGRFDTTCGKVIESRARIYAGVPLIIGSSNFTIECWVFTGTSATGQRYVMAQGPGGTASDMIMYINHLNGMSCNFLSANGLYEGANPPNDTWRHYAWTRNGGTQYLFRDGVLIDSDTISGTMGNYPFYIGCYPTSSGLTSHYIDDFIVYNKAIYTSNFTPRPFEPPAYQLNDKLIPRKELQRKQPTKLNQNYFIHRRGL